MIQIQHQVPGRVRFRVKPPTARCMTPGASAARGVGHGRPSGTDAWVQALADALRNEPGVRALRVNAVCASLVLHYDPARNSPEQLRAKASSVLLSPAQRHRPLQDLASGWPLIRRGQSAGGASSAARSRAGSHRRTVAHCRLCRVQGRLARWLLRSTLRCWWLEWRGGKQRQPTRPRSTPPAAARGGSAWWRFVLPDRSTADTAPQPLLARLRQRIGPSAGHPLPVVSVS